MRSIAAVIAAHVVVAISCAATKRDEPPATSSGSATAEQANAQVARDAAIEARVRVIERLGRSCKRSDWALLALIAADQYAWDDHVVPLGADHAFGGVDEPLEAFRCASMVMFYEIFTLAPSRPNFVVRRQFATAFVEPSVLKAIEDLLSDRVLLPPRCSGFANDADDIIRFAPLHQLRSVVQAHAPHVLEYLDRDRSYRIGQRALRIETWAAELTPEGFEHVLDVLAADYTWNDGAPPPTAAEKKEIKQHTLDMLFWLSLLVTGAPDKDCEHALQEAVASGPLGKKLLAHLDHPDPKVRQMLLNIIVQITPAGSRERLEQMQHRDPDPGLRRAAAGVLARFETGGVAREQTRKRDQQRENRAREAMGAP